MSETIARIADGGKIELVDERMIKIVGAQQMTPEEAAFLARGLLACAAVLTINKSAKQGAMIGDAHLPVLKWEVKVGTESRQPVIIFSIPPALALTFQLTTEVEGALGAALVAHAEGDQPPVHPPDRLQ
jgi:hypothetical protein